MPTRKQAEADEAQAVDEAQGQLQAAAADEAQAVDEQPAAVEVRPRFYNPERNPGGAFLPGVPLRDLTAAEFASYPAYLQRSIDETGFYFLSKPRNRSADEPAEE